MSLRRILLFATWLAGTLLATAIVYEAVHMVAGQVTLLQADGVSQAGVEQTGTQPTLAAAPASARPEPATTSPNPATSAAGRPPASATSQPTPPAPAATNPPQQSPPSATRTFSLVGGTASVTCSGGQITLNWATPNGGYEVETGSSSGGTQLEVRFRSDTHESRLEAWCAGGQIQSNIREESS